MTGRHRACMFCGQRILTLDEVGEQVAECVNRDCPGRAPTGPIYPTPKMRAAAETEMIRRSLRELHDRGER
jgi:hypothetical protein